MCGINGIWSKVLTDKPTLVDRMNNSLLHRGPDAGAIFQDDFVVLGHRRLSIIDLSEQGVQPMTSLDGRYTIVYNGELYNYNELKPKLNYPFKTNTDTEVILASYIENGKSCLDDFNGMFAFAIWDADKKELFVARDRLGIKPFYYYLDNDKFIFSSELRAILSTGVVEKKIDEEGLVDYLQYQTVHAPNTILKNIKMLLPGHRLRFYEGKIEIESYWKIGERCENIKDKEDAKKNIAELLTSAVEFRLVADVPFGAFLSGGIDSSIIVGLMSKVSSQKVNTFSVTFNEKEFSEEKYSSLIAKRFNTEHHNIQLSPNHFLKELPEALKAMDHPSGDGPNSYIVSKATKNAGITMALSGLGGDELFAGYDIFKRSKSLVENKILNHTPLFVRKAIGNVLATIKPEISSDKINEILSKDKIELESFYPTNRKLFVDKELNQLTTFDNYQNQVERILKSELQKGLPLLSNVSIAEITTYMQNVLLRDTDQMSMASALEVRVPFLDHRLVEYVLNIPDNIKYPNYPKQLLVESFEDLLPNEVVHRTKMGFVLPWKEWMKNELRSFCDTNLKSLKNRAYINPDYIEQIWKNFLSGENKITWSRIWGLVVLENWLQQHNIE